MTEHFTPEEQEQALALWEQLHRAALAYKRNQYRSVHSITFGDVLILLKDLDHRLNRRERGIQ